MALYWTIPHAASGGFGLYAVSDWALFGADMNDESSDEVQRATLADYVDYLRDSCGRVVTSDTPDDELTDDERGIFAEYDGNCQGASFFVIASELFDGEGSIVYAVSKD